MIDVKEAVHRAKTYAVEMYAEVDPLLEEVVSTEEGWQITLSFLRAADPAGLEVLDLIEPRLERTYKVFSFDGDGDFLAMKMRVDEDGRVLSSPIPSNA